MLPHFPINKNVLCFVFEVIMVNVLFVSIPFLFLFLYSFRWFLLWEMCKLSDLFFLLCRSSAQIMSYIGIELSSPTLASAILNLVPAFTFVLALIFRFHIFFPVLI